jgi:hypothetical protein
MCLVTSPSLADEINEANEAYFRRQRVGNDTQPSTALMGVENVS